MKTTISQLRVFEAVARTGSFSRAAEELGITQPSVSTQLRAIESHGKQRLIAREGHTITVTRFGNIVLPKVRAMLSILAEIERVFDDERSLQSGLLRLGYSTDQFAMPMISRFMAAHPGVKVEARSMASIDLIDLLRRGLIDAALITARSPPDGLSCERLRTDPIVLMVPVGHPIAGAGVVTWAELARYPIIRREATSGTRMIFDEAARAAGVSLRPLIDLGSWESMRAAVLAGMGVGIAVRGEVEPDDRIAVVGIDDAGLWASHFIAALPEMRHSATIDGLFAIATAFVAGP
ncbi:MAG: LysR family transcriptional regulator [Bauldia sp.]|nr:LysR family transcriptional regulator [Bauldia sp.]